MWLNFRAILAVLGYLTLAVGLGMLCCSVVELFTTRKEFDNFFINGLLLTFLGLAFGMANKSHINSKMSLKEGFLLVCLSWFWVVGISALPFYFSSLNVSFIDSAFESMSGYTTTGATIFPHLGQLSYGLHLWRALTQWVGGIGIIVTSTALISQLGSSGMQIFKIEAFETFDNPLEKAIDIIKGIIKIYIVLTIVFILALWLIAKMDFFNAVVHTFTSISTAGFSTKDASIGYFHNNTADIIIILMMLFGGSPFILIYYSIFLRRPSALLHDEQFKGYIITILVISAILSGWLFFENDFSFKQAVIQGTFTVVSTLTGTGSVISDYSKWGHFPIMLIFVTGFIGGCGGSSACGMKIYRFQIAFKIAKVTMQRLYQKNHIILPYYNKQIIDNQLAYLVFSYFFLMLVTILVVAGIFAAMGLDFVTAFTGSVTTLMNVGPGIGSIIGPAGTFAPLPADVKLVMIIAMFVGRIEIFGAFILFYKSFWRS